MDLLRRTPDWKSQPYGWNLTASLVALNRVEEALAARDTVEMLRPDDPATGATRAIVWSMLGRPDQARAVMDSTLASGNVIPTWTNWCDAVLYVRAGRVGLAEALLGIRARGPEALPELQAAVEDDDCVRCRDFYLGHGYELAGRPAEAIEAYERYVARPFYDGDTHVLLLLGPTVHERLGERHDREGDAARAAQHYRRFAELWAGADPDLRARVDRASARASELAASG